jgi:Type II CAAX prenyl endopeptidase Rce1-like
LGWSSPRSFPATNGFLHDSRAAISGGHVFYEFAVTILFGTVIPEELAFRGVLLGSALHLWGRWRAVLITSVLFGLWHITMTLHTQSDNQTVRHASAALVVLGAVAVTAAARVVFCGCGCARAVSSPLCWRTSRPACAGPLFPRRPPLAVVDALLAVNVAGTEHRRYPTSAQNDHEMPAEWPES